MSREIHCMITYTITLEVDLILDQTAPRVILIFDLLGKLPYSSNIVSLSVIWLGSRSGPTFCQS